MRDRDSIPSRAVIRAAILDTVDDCCQSGVWWEQDSRDEDYANRARLRFVDAVIARIAQLQGSNESER